MNIKAVRGFTLVEVVVALTVLSLISLATLAAMRTFGTTQQKLDVVSERTQEMRVISQFLRRTLTDVQPIMRQSRSGSYAYFQGDQQRLVWVAPFSASRYIGGLTVFRLSKDDDEQLVIQFTPYVDADADVDWSGVEQHVLVKQLDDVVMSYKTAPENTQGSNIQGEWRTTWEGLAVNPNSIRIAIAAQGRYWPDLIIHFNEVGENFVRF